MNSIKKGEVDNGKKQQVWITNRGWSNSWYLLHPAEPENKK